MDRKYLRKIAEDVFGSECLAISSVLGNPARNANKQHAPLDTVKLDFVRGKLTVYPLIKSFFSDLLISSIMFSDIFKQRTGSDERRFDKFNEIMNKHCGNARRVCNG